MMRGGTVQLQLQLKYEGVMHIKGYVIGLVAATVGGLLTVAGKYMTAKFTSRTEDTVSLRDSMLKRISQAEKRQAMMEKRQAMLENDVQIWMRRYWALYRWAVSLSVNHDVDILPPNFHEMEQE